MSEAPYSLMVPTTRGDIREVIVTGNVLSLAYWSEPVLDVASVLMGIEEAVSRVRVLLDELIGPEDAYSPPKS